jgi:hypothetical protein
VDPDAEWPPLLRAIYPRLSHGAWIPTDVSITLEAFPFEFPGWEVI